MTRSPWHVRPDAESQTLHWYRCCTHYVLQHGVRWEDREDLVHDMTVLLLEGPPRRLSLRVAFLKAVDRHAPRRWLWGCRQHQPVARGPRQQAPIAGGRREPWQIDLLWLQRAWDTLPPRTQAILRAYYHDEQTLQTIARQHGLTEARICQLVRATLRSLAQHMEGTT